MKKSKMKGENLKIKIFVAALLFIKYIHKICLHTFIHAGMCNMLNNTLKIHPIGMATLKKKKKLCQVYLGVHFHEMQGLHGVQSSTVHCWLMPGCEHKQQQLFLCKSWINYFSTSRGLRIYFYLLWVFLGSYFTPPTWKFQYVSILLQVVLWLFYGKRF